MKAYIKTNAKDEIIDFFFEYQKNKLDGNEIFFGDVLKVHKINGKSISNEHGVFIFTWDGSVKEKTQSEIDNDSDFILFYKKLKKDELQAYIGLHTLDILPNHTWTEIVTQWASFKSSASSWTTKQQVDTAYDTAIVWLHS